MHPRQAHFLKIAVALSFLVGCTAEPSPDPGDPPDSPPDDVLRLEGRLVDASGAAAPFVPVRLGGKDGPIVATDEAGGFTFPDLPPGTYSVYAHDEFSHSVGFASVELASASQDGATTVELQSCNDILENGSAGGVVVVDICWGSEIIDLPPAEEAAVLGAVELSSGLGFTAPHGTSTHNESNDVVRDVYFVFNDGLALGGVREFAVADHRLVGSDPDADPFQQPSFSITLQDAHGSQSYVVRDGSFRVEVVAPQDGTRSFVLTASDLVMDYSKSFYEFDAAYTLTVPSVRLEGTMDALLPPVPPEGDLTAALPDAFVTNTYDSANKRVKLVASGIEYETLLLTLDLTRLALPGTVDVELPLGETPNVEGDLFTMDAVGEAFSWRFQPVSYSVTTEMTELPACKAMLTVTLENLVFRYVDWDYDENSDQVLSFGDQTLTIDRFDVATELYDPSTPGCS
jgi:hypothetical protein